MEAVTREEILSQPDKYLKLVAVAKILGVSTRDVNVLLQNQKLQFVRLGKFRLTLSSSLDDYINSLQIKQVRVRSKNYKVNARCKEKACSTKPTHKGFCHKHYAAWKRGQITDSGENNLSYQRVKRSYGRDFRCFKCLAQGMPRYRLGFCDKCYEQYHRGYMDFYGRPTDQDKRIPYTSLDKCKIKGCEYKPEKRFFCATHYQGYRAGRFDVFGTPLRKSRHRRRNSEIAKTCKVCGDPAEAKDLCNAHYKRLLANGTLESVYKNKGQICVEDGCGKEARLRTLCWNHYYRFMHKLPMNLELRTKNQGKTCTENGCVEASYVKGLCKRHYSKAYKAKVRKKVSGNECQIPPKGFVIDNTI